MANDNSIEQEAVRTTIVGGRPPGSGKSNGRIPRGIEVLVKKASVDAAFCEALLKKRSTAANEIGLELNPTESVMLSAIPESQLIGIIHNTRVSPKARPAFMGYAAAAMLAALGVAVGCGPSGEEVVSEEAVSEETALNDTEESLSDGKQSPNIPLGLPTGNDLDERADSGVLDGKGGMITGIRPDYKSIEYNNVSVLASYESISGPGANDVNRSHDVLDRINRSKLDGVEILFVNERKRDPNISGGTVKFGFIISKDGSVGDLEIIGDEIENDRLNAGVAFRIRNWKYPPASDEVTVVLPMVFMVTE